MAILPLPTPDTLRELAETLDSGDMKLWSSVDRLVRTRRGILRARETLLRRAHGLLMHQAIGKFKYGWYLDRLGFTPEETCTIVRRLVN